LNHSDIIRSAHKEEITRGNDPKREKLNQDILNAAIYVDIASVWFHLARDSRLQRKTDSVHQMPLLYAAQYGHASVCSFLLECGGDIDD
jgi:hypothetical protein